jgi:hypothetical protein
MFLLASRAHYDVADAESFIGTVIAYTMLHDVGNLRGFRVRSFFDA